MVGLEVLDYKGEGYFSPYGFDTWKVAFLHSAKRFTREGITYLERHTQTDEVFVLLAGRATLLMGENADPAEMEQGKLYIVKQAEWHNIIVSEDAEILIVENADTGTHNTEYMPYHF